MKVIMNYDDNYCEFQVIADNDDSNIMPFQARYRYRADNSNRWHYGKDFFTIHDAQDWFYARVTNQIKKTEDTRTRYLKKLNLA